MTATARQQHPDVEVGALWFRRLDGTLCLTALPTLDFDGMPSNVYSVEVRLYSANPICISGHSSVSTVPLYCIRNTVQALLVRKMSTRPLHV